MQSTKFGGDESGARHAPRTAVAGRERVSTLRYGNSWRTIDAVQAGSASGRHETASRRSGRSALACDPRGLADVRDDPRVRRSAPGHRHAGRLKREALAGFRGGDPCPEGAAVNSQGASAPGTRRQLSGSPEGTKVEVVSRPGFGATVAPSGLNFGRASAVPGANAPGY